MKPKLVHNWPQVKDDNDIIAKRIIEAIDKYNSSNKDREAAEKLVERSLINNHEENNKKEILNNFSNIKNIQIQEKDFVNSNHKKEQSGVKNHASNKTSLFNGLSVKK